ncbi:alkylhydroperoxidase AhpD [Actinomyces sp. Chiba101]|uniref:carboxymuconolactone decarboxylase family protein n=1 Tax=Actinomyces TaxID=1654 RepID=UPI000974F1BA|nr:MULTISPECIES: carboxymuconolactone decarboxylase family protein [Actinomyces]BAW92026.1 alkylhydroperoxidase AhpD [Actinomyces sp. Chiba101]GAV95043.1 hypothetical protein ADENT20671_1821 [Actinomyces denticolens]SUU11903.1 Argininosuccinate synthase [Actinomyces denticolens]
MTSINLFTQHSDSLSSLKALTSQVDTAFQAAGLSERLAELINVRVSQINGCAFCLRTHVEAALKAGEQPERLTVLAAWWETQYFDAQERAALGLAEQVTRLGVPEDRSWDDGSLTSEQVGAVVWAATVIGAWNRVVLSSHPKVGPQA